MYFASSESMHSVILQIDVLLSFDEYPFIFHV